MPEKVITEAITSSRSWRRLSDPARALFVPLLVKTDAWGKREADLEEIRFDCLPGLEWPDEKLLSVLEEYVREEMIELYLVERRWYLRVINHDRFQRRLVGMRKGRSRFPDPACVIDASMKFDGLLFLAREYGSERPVKPEDLIPGLSPTDPPRARENRNSLGFAIEEERDLWTLAAEVRDADQGTLHIFRKLREQGLPPAAFAAAREALLERRRHPSRPRLGSEVRFVVSELKSALADGRYAA